MPEARAAIEPTTIDVKTEKVGELRSNIDAI
jgi:hypothetical protein